MGTPEEQPKHQSNLNYEQLPEVIGTMMNVTHEEVIRALKIGITGNTTEATWTVTQTDKDNAILGKNTGTTYTIEVITTKQAKKIQKTLVECDDDGNPTNITTHNIVVSDEDGNPIMETVRTLNITSNRKRKRQLTVAPRIPGHGPDDYEAGGRFGVHHADNE